MSDKRRRLAVLRVTPECVAEMLKPWTGSVRWVQVVDNPLPPDARVVNVFTWRDEVRIVLESETFAPVNPEELVPILPDVTFRTFYEDDDGERERPPGPAA